MSRAPFCRTAVLVSLLCAGTGWGQQKFSELVGNVAVQPVRTSTPLEVPYITWGGDVATFSANGGLTTAPGRSSRVRD